METNEEHMCATHQRIVLGIFTLTLFVSASLLFWIQPLLAKMVLPYLGGSPSVWNTCMMFFQGTLLLGYIYAHLLSFLPSRVQSVIHISFLIIGLLFLPFVIHSEWFNSSTSPIFTLVSVLFFTAAVPIIAISASAPLLQHWFIDTKHPQASDPYFLYSASNAGSLIALLSFPFILEPALTLSQQSTAWTVGFSLFIALGIICAVMSHYGNNRAPISDESHLSNHITASKRMQWLALTFIPSSLLLGLTTYITTDIASVPLFWVIPLALYLVTFIFAFARKQPISQSTAQILQLSLLLPFLLIMTLPLHQLPIWLKFSTHLSLFFCTAYVCHTQLVKLRPHHERLTEFYLWVAFGGFLGGVFNTLIAPVIFIDTWEYPIVLMLSLLLVRPKYINKYVMVTAIVIFLGAHYYFLSDFFKNSVYTTRNFFGTTRVVRFNDKVHYLLHGTTTHGLQLRTPGKQKSVLSYYQPLVALFKNLDQRNDKLNIAITGLGTGSCACLARKNDRVTFYEINPDIVDIANNPSYFSFLTLCPPKGGIVLGDARLNVQKANIHSYDVMVLDAFSSDSIPVHLLTDQAIKLYFTKLKNDGILLINISNRYLDLENTISTLGANNSLQVYYGYGRKDKSKYIYASKWILLARKEIDIAPLIADQNWHKLNFSDPKYLWTDDYSNIVRTLR